MSNKPDDNQIEITLLARGFGESVVVHLGGGRWAIVDTFVDDSNQAAALTYLERMGVGPEDVVCICITHLDADHYKGIDRLVAACKTARLCTSIVTDKDVYKELVNADITETLVGKMGVASRLAAKRQTDGYRPLGPSQLAWNSAPPNLPMATLMAISPTDPAVNAMSGQIATELGIGNVDALKASLKDKNRGSVALHGQIGEISFLLCGDVLAKPAKLGWRAVLSNRDVQGLSRVSLVKASHHGSHTGHNDQMWNDRVHEDGAHVLVAPFTSQKIPIPKLTDVDRLCGLAHELHQGHPSTPKATRSPDDAVLMESSGVGVITARRRLGDSSWTIEPPTLPAWTHDCETPSTSPFQAEN